MKKGHVYVAIFGDRNVIKKEAENILKHKDITIEIQHRTIHNNKPDIITSDNEKGTCICCNFWRQKCDEERSREHSKT